MRMNLAMDIGSFLLCLTAADECPISSASACYGKKQGMDGLS